jgi:5'-AMP-activated protein kinase catalytic alpha subunit
VGRLDEQEAGLYFMQLLDAEMYLRRQGICHRDIKPENIIVKDDRLKLIDFGLSHYCGKGEWLKTSCGSPCYAAPEMMSEKRYDSEKTEVWALGVTLYAMLTGRLPFEHDNTQKLYKIMASNRYEEIPHIS